MQHLDSYGRALWEKGETDYQKAARAFLQEALESEDPFKYLRSPVADRMSMVFSRCRRAHLEALPVPPAPGEPSPVFAVPHPEVPTGVQEATPPEDRHDGKASPEVPALTNDIRGDVVQQGDGSHATDGHTPREQDLTGHDAQMPDESHGRDGVVPREESAVTPVKAAGNAALPTVATPAQRRLAQLSTEIYIHGKGLIPWEEVTDADCLRTIAWSQTVINGIRVNAKRLELAVALMRRHRVGSVSELPIEAAARIFGEEAA